MNPRFLIIDDDITFCNTLMRAFRKIAIDADAAHNQKQALALLEHGDAPKAILLDLRLGQDNGLMLLTHLRQHCPHTRIVMLTGFGSIATAVEAMKRGADDYLIKPVSFDDILDALTDQTEDKTPKEESTHDHSAALLIDDLEPLNLRQMAWEHIQHVLAEHGGNVSAAARTLGVHRRTLQRKLSKVPRN